MRREIVTPRPDWKKRVEKTGFNLHTIGGRPYWDESVCYVFRNDETEVLARAARELHDLGRRAVEHVIRHRLYTLVGVPEKFAPVIERSWERGDPGIIGRFDFRHDGLSPPKMFEYNADTPTSLPEAAVVQQHWLQEKFPGAASFNTIHHDLIRAWSRFRDRRVHFCACTFHREDAANAAFHKAAAVAAGVVATGVLAMNQIGWNQRRSAFLDPADRKMENIFKLYPWEWIFREPFAEYLIESGAQWIEPPWKAILTSKGLLPILWELFPEHPNLLPAFRSPEKLSGNFAKKPVLSREGANITLCKNGSVFRSSAGRYGASGFIWQALSELPSFDGNHPVVGVWMVGDEPCGLGVREDSSPITGYNARFVPHRLEM